MVTHVDVAFCCASFKDKFLQRGARGPSFAVIDDDGKPLFMCCGAAVATENSAAFTSLCATPFPVSSFFSFTIRYCPWCGVSLRHYYSLRDAWRSMVDDELTSLRWPEFAKRRVE